MRRQYHWSERKQRVRRIGWLLLEYIEPGRPDLAAPQGGCQRLFVNDAATRSVDQDRASLHGGNFVFAHNRAIGFGRVDGDSVSPGDPFQEIVSHLYFAFRPTMFSKPGVVGAHFHPEIRAPDARGVFRSDRSR